MIVFVIIICIIVTLYFMFWEKNAEVIDVAVNKVTKKEESKSDTSEPQDFQLYTDEYGKQYRLMEKTRDVPRRTYIKAKLNGKYRGEIIEDFSKEFEHSRFYSFTIYEASLKNAVYSTSGPFQIEQDLKIPPEKLPSLLHTTLENNDMEYSVGLKEPVFSHIKLNRKLHQHEGEAVFGTIEAVVIGYVLDFTTEKYTEREYLLPDEKLLPTPAVDEIPLSKTRKPTGKVERSGDYTRTEFFYSDQKRRYWGAWKYHKRATESKDAGCYSSLMGAFSIFIGISFLLIFLPQMVVLLPFFLFLFLLNLIPASLLRWLFGMLGLLLLLAFLISVFRLFNSGNHTYVTKVVVTEDRQEDRVQTQPISDTVDKRVFADTLIKHLRVWRDYEGDQYEGVIWMRQSDFQKSKQFKNGLVLNHNTERAYDELIFLLKENDKDALTGVYEMFDSIRSAQHFSRVRFAELIVSFVQDIPYTLIVPNDCNPDLYDDRFIREFLSSDNARCDGFEKFGINSPVEFMSTLNGDCDTRTLLLYSILAHYDYDVAILSSEYYNHSIIGVNLPIDGKAYQYRNQRYVLWETTAPGIRAGMVSAEVSNLSYWRISLKSR